MKSFICSLGLLLAFKMACPQNLNLPQTSSDYSEVDISSSQVLGYSLLGVGLATIGYTAAQTHHNKYPGLWYTGGSMLATAGILILIFGDKESPVKYWKGMEGHLPSLQYRTGAINTKFDNGFPVSVNKFNSGLPLK